METKMKRRNTKVAIVTGASRGIGAAIARRIALDGFCVVINYTGSAEPAAALAAEIEWDGGVAITAEADVSAPDAVGHMFDVAEQAFGGVDAVINNARIMKRATIAESDDALFDRQVATNLKGAFNVLREAAHRVRSGGCIVSLSVSLVKRESYGVYAATKAAVETLTAILSEELHGRNITVNAVSAGPIGTEPFLEGHPPEVIKLTARTNPLHRLGEPNPIAAAVAFLVGTAGACINGQVLRANGGMI